MVRFVPEGQRRLNGRRLAQMHLANVRFVVQSETSSLRIHAIRNRFTVSTNSSTPFDPAEWLSQADAARLRGVTRQAIAKLVTAGRFRTLEIGGHVLVNRHDVEAFTPAKAGRPARDG